MTKEHSIATPSQGLVLQWSDEWYKAKVKHTTREKYMCTQAALWGADQELDACCEWLSLPCPSYGRELRNARRAKLSNLKDQVREIIECLVEVDCVTDEDALTLRRTLDFLPLES